MTVENLQRFDVAALKRLAGGAFARGEAYHREGRNRAYEEAAGLIARMGRLRRAAEQTAYVATLKERFGRKRNFTKLLG